MFAQPLRVSFEDGLIRQNEQGSFELRDHHNALGQLDKQNIWDMNIKEQENSFEIVKRSQTSGNEAIDEKDVDLNLPKEGGEQKEGGER